VAIMRARNPIPNPKDFLQVCQRYVATGTVQYSAVQKGQMAWDSHNSQNFEIFEITPYVASFLCISLAKLLK